MPTGYLGWQVVLVVDSVGRTRVAMFVGMSQSQSVGRLVKRTTRSRPYAGATQSRGIVRTPREGGAGDRLERAHC